MDRSSLNMLADAASGVLETKKRVASNRICSTCAQCQTLCPTALALEDHAKRTHHGAWVCSVASCGVSFKNRSAFSKHNSRHNNPDRGYQCQQCGHSFPRKDNLFEHRAIHGRCKPSKSHASAQCSPDRSKRRKLNDQIVPPSAPGGLIDSIPTAIDDSLQPQLLSTIEHSDHSWLQLSTEPIIDTGSRVTSINYLQAWEHTYEPVDDQSSSGHPERSVLEARTSNSNEKLFYLMPGRFKAFSTPEHHIPQHVGEAINSGTTNDPALCQDIDHAGGDMPDDHRISADNVSDVATVLALPGHTSMNEGLPPSNQSEAKVAHPRAESDVMALQQNPPWLTWLQERRWHLKLGHLWELNDMSSRHASEIQVILELALLYYSQQELRDIMSNLSIADLLNEELMQAPGWDVYQAAIEECRIKLIPDLPTLCSFFDRDLAVGTGTHQALWSFAVRSGQNEMVELLLEKGAHPDQEVLGSTKSDRIPLVVASNQNNWNLSKFLLKRGADPNVRNDDEDSILRIAMENEEPELVKLLLEKTIEHNLTDQRGNHGVLLAAITRGYIDVVEFLLDSGVDINIKGPDPDPDRYKLSPLTYAVMGKQNRMVKLLLEEGADPNFGCQNKLHHPLSLQRQIAIFGLLLDNGAEENITRRSLFYDDGLELSPLILAIEQGELAMVKSLLESGADPNFEMQSAENLTALVEAISYRHTEIVKLLIDYGAHINARSLARWDYRPITPLCAAIANPQTRHEQINEMVQILLDHGADPNLPEADDSDEIPLCWALQVGDADTVRLLLAKDVRVEPGVEECMDEWFDEDERDSEDYRTKLKLIEEARLKQGPGQEG